MSTISEMNNDTVRIVSIGVLDLTLHLTLTKTQAEEYNVDMSKLKEAKDLSVLFENTNDSKEDSFSSFENESITNLITLTSDNPLINSLLYINRAFRQRCFIEYITYNEICFSEEMKFFNQVIKEVTHNNFLYIIQYRLKDVPSKVYFEIKIVDDDSNEVIEKKKFDLFEKNYDVDPQMTKNESCFFLFLNFDFSHDYFFADFNNLLELKQHQYEELSLFYVVLLSKFPKIKIITNFNKNLINENEHDIQFIDTVKELINNSDIIIMDAEDMKKLYSIYAENTSKKFDKKELPIVSDRDKKRKHIKRVSLVINAMMNMTVYVQSGSNMFLEEKNEFSLTSLHREGIFDEEESHISSGSIEENVDFFKAVFIGGFFSRFVYGKTFNTCVTAGNLMMRKMIDIIKYNIDNITNISVYQVVVPKLKSKIDEMKKIDRKIKEKEDRFVLDCVNRNLSQKKDYNSLYDKYCQSFFASKTTRSHLHQFGFITKKGLVLKDPGFHFSKTRMPSVNREKATKANLTMYSSPHK